MNEESDNQIRENASGPKRASGDSGSIEQHAIQDQIAADRYLASKKAAQSGGLGIRLAQLVPPLFEAARTIAAKRGAQRATAAMARAESELAAEVERLEALARVNPGVRPQEIAAARDELDSLRKLLPESRVRGSLAKGKDLVCPTEP